MTLEPRITSCASTSALFPRMGNLRANAPTCLSAPSRLDCATATEPCFSALTVFPLVRLLISFSTRTLTSQIWRSPSSVTTISTSKTRLNGSMPHTLTQSSSSSKTLSPVCPSNRSTAMTSFPGVPSTVRRIPGATASRILQTVSSISSHAHSPRIRNTPHAHVNYGSTRWPRNCQTTDGLTSRQKQCPHAPLSAPSRHCKGMMPLRSSAGQQIPSTLSSASCHGLEDWTMSARVSARS